MYIYISVNPKFYLCAGGDGAHLPDVYAGGPGRGHPQNGS